MHCVPASVCRRCPERPRTRSGRPLTVEPGAPGRLADPYGPTAELGGPGKHQSGRVGDLGMTRVVSERLCTAVMYT